MLAAAAVGPPMETSFMPWRPAAHPYGGRPKGASLLGPTC